MAFSSLDMLQYLCLVVSVSYLRIDGEMEQLLARLVHFECQKLIRIPKELIVFSIRSIIFRYITSF